MRFNFFSRNSASIVNHEGAPAFTLTPQLELYAAVATVALSDQFYGMADARLLRLRDLLAKNDPVFVAQVAVYARESLHLRTVLLEVRPETGVAHIAGWSDKVLDVLSALDNGGSALTEIEKIDL